MDQKNIPVMRFRDADEAVIGQLAAHYGMKLVVSPDGENIPGSFWGEEEAGLVVNELVVRQDTPLHSLLHEACHYICMDADRRAGLNTDAGGDYDEENGVCYLQILLADEIPGFGRERMMKDMDAWGYTFRFGSARAWFDGDAEDAREWLQSHAILDETGKPAFTLRI